MAKHVANETLIGTDHVNNTLIGDVGNDTLIGGNDSDINLLYGDTDGTMSGSAHGGNDILIGGNLDASSHQSLTDEPISNLLYGDAYTMTGSAHGGNDTLTGGSNSYGLSLNNYLYGDAYSMTDTAQGGNDTLIGGNEIGRSDGGDNGTVNYLYGDAYQMSGFAHGGNNTLIGGNSSAGGGGGGLVFNAFYGAAKSLSDFAQAGNNTLIAGTETAGRTVINDMWGSGQLNDNATGGHDTFVFKDNVAAGQTVGTQNTIEDFHQSQDVIKFAGVFAGATHITSFDQLVINQSGGNTVIHAGEDAVTLVGFTGILTAHDFVFA
jgi:hypothetical protein